MAAAPTVLARLPGSVAQQTANFNTLLNVAIAVLALPLLGPISGLLAFLIEAPEGAPAERESYLDATLLQSPSLALSQATREELRMLDELRSMLRAAAGLLAGGGTTPAGAGGPQLARIDQHARRIDDTAEEIRLYLGQIGDDSLSAGDSHWKFVLLDFSQELEAVARLIRRDLADAAIRGAKVIAGAPPPAADREEIDALVGLTLERMEKAAAVLMSRTVGRAEELILEKSVINARCRRLQ
ncbi:MAG: Na/Pi cotransporter family protein, partial [Acidobacteria bacterium]|nr:Na/Pi cotransporter family protein [Acidobacteriota bacterium]